MMPGVQVLPADDSEEGNRSAELVNAVLTAMSGSLLDVFRDQLLREAVVTGFFVAEPVQRVIHLPSFGGPVKGLDSIKVRPSEGFTDNLVFENGQLVKLVQRTAGAVVEVTPDQVLYWAFHGSPYRPYGRSVLHAAYDPWKLKEVLFRLYAVFCSVNASGLRIMDVPDKDFERVKADVYASLKKMGEYASIVKRESQKLNIDMPSSGAGGHFIMGIREVCNKEIRKAILYDETINAEGMSTGSYASKRVSQQDVYESMASQGWAYCEAIAEQLFRRILDWNGFTSWPVPILSPEPPPRRDADIAPTLAALSQATSSLLITEPLPKNVQVQILRRALAPHGVIYEEESAEVDRTPDKAHEHRRSPKSVNAGAPPGRTRADILRLKKRAIIAEREAVDGAVETWVNLVPGIVASLNGTLFEKSGAWKTRDYAALREAAEKAVTSGGSKLRAELTDRLLSRWTEGADDAAKMLPVKAAAVVTPVTVSPVQAANMLRQRVYLILQDIYGGTADSLYFILENAVNGNLTAQQAIPRIRQTLLDSGITPGRAGTILNTAMSSAYNGGRMSLFSSLSDPDGVTPGGIIGYELSAVMDDFTTDTCEELNDKFFRVDDPNLPSPPLHYNCRSVLIPVFSGEEPWNGGKGWISLEDSKKLSAGIMPGFGGV
jgi:SPP1 gp7 family putative phage head morphogenesis protein